MLRNCEKLLKNDKIVQKKMCVLFTKRGSNYKLALNCNYIDKNYDLWYNKMGFLIINQAFLLEKNAAAQLTTILTNTMICGIIKWEI